MSPEQSRARSSAGCSTRERIRARLYFKYEWWKAVDYANRWVGDLNDVMSPSGYNPAYYHFNKLVNGHWEGNDCQNFVSQALRVGGWTKDYGIFTSDAAWWYRGGGRFDHTRTWSAVENFRRYSCRATARTSSTKVETR